MVKELIAHRLHRQEDRANLKLPRRLASRGPTRPIVTCLIAHSLRNAFSRLGLCQF